MNKSFQSRMGFSLFANFLKSAITFGSGLFIARGLGPEQYGTMVFLLGTFVALRQLLDMGSSSAFFTFLSQTQRGHRFVGYYFAWLGVQFFVVLIAVGLLFPSAWVDLIWKGEQRFIVVLAFIAAYSQGVLWSTLLQMGESQRKTRFVQALAVAAASSQFIVLVAINWFHTLTPGLVFTLTTVVWAIAAVIMARNLNFDTASDHLISPKVVFSKFWGYCAPLLPYSWMGFAYEFSDRWLLQEYGGGVQQAYFAIAYQFGTVAAIVTTSTLNILWKETSDAHYAKDFKRTIVIYNKLSRFLFFISASIGCFLAFWTEEILLLTLGPDYVGGAMALSIMFMYSMHQSMGAIGSTLALAIEQVTTYVKLGMVFMACSIFCSYFVLANSEAVVPGLGLGSIGLAGKMFILQVIQVNVLAFYLSRSMSQAFEWRFQPIIFILCGSAGFVSSFMSRLVLGENYHVLFLMALSSIIYLVFMMIVIAKLPGVIGFNNDTILKFMTLLKANFTRSPG